MKKHEVIHCHKLLQGNNITNIEKTNVQNANVFGLNLPFSFQKIFFSGAA